MDESFDFVIVGSGAGSMCAALVMRAQGKRVLVLEKAELLGGTTCTSGGVMWIPNNRFMSAGEDSHDKAAGYLASLAEGQEDAPAVTRERQLAFVREAPRMLEFLESQGVKLHRIPLYPDYYSEVPGAVDTSRTVGADIFDLNRLGPYKDKLRPGFLPVPATIPEAFNLPWVKSSKAAKKVMGKIIGRVLMAKLTGKKLVSGGAALQAQVLAAAVKAGVEIRANAPVKQIVLEGGRVTGVLAEIDGAERRIGAAAGVLINAGGFARSQEMRDHYIPGTKAEWTSASAGDTGELIREAMRLGAAVGQMSELVGQPILLPPGRPPALAHGEVTKPHSILVDQTGQRFMSEAQSYVELTRGLLERNAKAPAVPSWLVFDSQFLAKYMFAGSFPGGKKPEAWSQSGFLRQGETIEALAAACDLDPAALRATVERFNGFARQGRDEDFGRGSRFYDQWLGDPSREGAAKSLGEIAQGPFYAVQVYPGDVSTFGGLVTDDQARVLREDGSAIPGLYATGTSTASVFGRRSPGAGASIGPAFTFAYIAAKHAAHAGNFAEAAA